MVAENQKVTILSAIERRERRKKKILENAEQRIEAILKGPDGTENRQPPSFSESTSPSSVSGLQFPFGAMTYDQGVSQSHCMIEKLAYFDLVRRCYVAFTFIVPFLLAVFKFLAFKNESKFWSAQNRSIHSVLFNVFQSIVALLYTYDNGAHWIVLIAIAIGLVIELWKIPKMLSEKCPRVESNAKEIDKMPFKHLYWLLFPLLGGYSVYCLMYDEYTNWYGLVLEILLCFLQVFSFVRMITPLFINYESKSISPVSWLTLVYKYLVTFTDDLVSFVIPIPMMFQLGCLRDDIIFLVYLCQVLVYRVDPKRVSAEVEESRKTK